jgi:D-serine deaminase-like pyridoxal phosphate-dependent protein
MPDPQSQATGRVADGHPVPLHRVPVPGLPPNLDTPCLIIDLDTVEANAGRAAEGVAARGVRLRPHVKTHKSVALARIQRDHGAVGLTVGTLGEAEVFAGADFTDLFLAYPVWAVGEKASRLRALHEAIDLSVGVDSVRGAERLADAVAGSGRPLRILVELDSGDRRTGVQTPAEAVEIALRARDLGLDVVGVFTHGGHGYLGRDARDPAGADEVRVLGEASGALRGHHFKLDVVSAGSTPTMFSAAAGQVTEIRAGTYLLGDRQQLALGAIPVDGVALHVATTIVSVEPPYVYIDTGAKTLTKDVPTTLEGYGFLPEFPEATIERVTDYHGVIRIPDGTPSPQLGQVVAVIPNHVCPVVDLFDTFTATRQAEIIGIWPVDARGRSG